MKSTLRLAMRSRRAPMLLAAAGLALASCGDGADGPSARACDRLADADLASLLGGQIKPMDQRIDDAPERRIYISTCVVRRAHGSRTLTLMLREQRQPNMPLASEQLRRLKESIGRGGGVSWTELSGLGEAAAWTPELRQLVMIDDEGRRAFLFSVSAGGDPAVVAKAAAEAALD